MTDQKQELLALCAKNVIGHAMGNKKYTNDIYKQYEFLMQEGTEELKELVQRVFQIRGVWL